jgi:protein-tyrosine phosphatase
MIDLHCHLLPGVDDGPADLDGSIAMARAHVAAGVAVVACTPHVNWQTPTAAPDMVAGVEALRAALEHERIPLRILTGGEVGLTRAVEMPDEELSAFKLGGGPWLLLEAPLDVATGVEQAVALVASRGHRVLLAHPERSPAFQRDADAVGRLVAAGVACQVTATALTGAFGSTAKRCATELMRAGLIHIVASDAHDTVRRPPGLRQPLAEAGFAALAEDLSQRAPAAIVAGEVLPARAAPAAPRGRWWRRG